MTDDKQGSLFSLGESEESKSRKRISARNSFMGLCEMCSYQGEVWRCEYCGRTFCEDCGGKRKCLCELCQMFYDARPSVALPRGGD